MGYGFGLWFCGFVVCGLVLHRKIRLTQLWVELSWVVAIKGNVREDTAVVEEKGGGEKWKLSSNSDSLILE